MSVSKSVFEKNFNDANKFAIEKKLNGSSGHISNETKQWAHDFERRLDRSMPKPTGNPGKDLIALENHLAFLDKMKGHFEGISQSCEDIRVTFDRMCGKHPEPEKHAGKIKGYLRKVSEAFKKIQIKSSKTKQKKEANGKQ